MNVIPLARKRRAPVYRRQLLLNTYLPHHDIPFLWKLDPEAFEAAYRDKPDEAAQICVDICKRLSSVLKAQQKLGRRKVWYYTPAFHQTIRLLHDKEHAYLQRLVGICCGETPNTEITS